MVLNVSVERSWECEEVITIKCRVVQDVLEV